MIRFSFKRIYLFLVPIVALMLVACNSGGAEPDEDPLIAEDFGLPTTAETGDELNEVDELNEDLASGEATLLDHHGQPIGADIYEKVEQDGVAVEFTVEGFSGLGGRGTILNTDVAEGAYTAVKFNITDAETGEPLAGLRPAAWMDPHPESAVHTGAVGEVACRDQIQTYLTGFLNARALVDLNSFFILGLNEDATISVIDPLANVGGMTQLYAMMLLRQPGEDWDLSADQEQVYVTIPSANMLAVIDTNSFQVEADLEVGTNPVRVAVQPGAGTVWVGNDSGDGGESGVTAVDPVALNVAGFVKTGRGHHELAFSADGELLYVTNSDDGSLTVIDTSSREIVDEVDAGRRPLAVAYSEESGAVYVADVDEGLILVFDGTSLEPLAEIEADPGLSALAFAPGGRWGFATNPDRGKIYVIDPGTNTVTHAAQVGGAPDQIAFSDNLAYVRARDAAFLATIPLDKIDPAAELPLTTVPVGTAAPGEFGQLTSANAVFPAPDGAGVMVANPADGQIHYYVEGATSSLGSFEGHGRKPRAALVVDRSLKEEAPGVYVGRLRIPQSGEYEVAFLLNNPWVSHCFYFTAAPNPELQTQAALAPPVLELLTSLDALAPGETLELQFKLTNSASEEPLAGIEDVTALVGPVTGIWQNRIAATPLAEAGVYQLDLTLDDSGLYNLFFSVPSRGYNAEDFLRYTITVAAEEGE